MNILDQNSFNITGNFSILKIVLFEYGYIHINTNLFFDLINLCELPFYLSFDIFIIFIINEIKLLLQEIDEGKNDKKDSMFPAEIKFNFNKYKKCIDLIKYYLSHEYSHNYCIANALFIMDNNFDNTKDNISKMTEKYIDLIHNYFITIIDTKNNLNKAFNKSINLELFFLYHFNIVYNSNINLKSDIFIKN